MLVFLIPWASITQEYREKLQLENVFITVLGLRRKYWSPYHLSS